ncbi:signal-transducing adaptor protein 1 [Rhea pennata]|uniref:signal-transducing adaptor protein 1 n=1 Tax=Rhea pennata TaxID=8795 RepID=UPI002E25D0B0
MQEPEKIPKPAPRRIFHERQRVTGLPLYFQGYLSIRRSGCQEFKMYWTELRGTVLFFYDDKKAPTYSQKLDISALISVTNIYPNENGFAQFILMLSNEELELKAEDCEFGKEWKGFILTVTKLSVPLDESLSPGQFMRMHEVLEKERKRRMMLNDSSSASLNEESPPSRNYSSTSTTMPICFHAVSRQEAIEMLEKNPSCGNLVLRPGSNSKNYAITVRQLIDAPFIKHYRVITKEASFVIELERQVTLMSLHDVINYFVTQTRGNLKPFVMPAYDNMLQSKGMPTSEQVPREIKQETIHSPEERPLLAPVANQILPQSQGCTAPHQEYTKE